MPAVDGNVLRVFARLTAHRGDVLKPAVRRELRDVVSGVLPPDAAGLFNEAVMELGETVCLPNARPRCEVCPLSAVCAAHAEGIEEELPTRAAPKPRRVEYRTVVCVTTDEPTPRVWLRKRPDTGLLAKLWEFPQIEGTLSPDEAAARFGLLPKTSEQLPPARHIFSHLEWQMTGVHLTVAPFTPPEGTVLVTSAKQREGHAIPGAFAAYAAYLDEWLR